EVLFCALAFATSVPAGKILLRGLPPMAISGGLYLAAGLFCLGLMIADPERKATTENRLKGGEWWWLSAAVGCGGVLGPLALFYGLRWSSGYTAGLLLNFEAVFTVGLGALLSGERVGMRGLRGIALVIVAAVASVLVVGAVSYGLSIVLFIRGLRELGVMHTGALFALAPGMAAVLSWLVLREPVHPLALLALTAMTGGALLLATDVHDHAH